MEETRDGPTGPTGPTGPGEDLRELFLGSLETLRSAQMAASRAISKGSRDGTVPLTELVRAQKELATTMKVALDMETQIDEWKRRQTGDEGASSSDVDLDDARYQIGCRLDRLRACCHSS